MPGTDSRCLLAFLGVCVLLSKPCSLCRRRRTLAKFVAFCERNMQVAISELLPIRGLRGSGTLVGF